MATLIFMYAALIPPLFLMWMVYRQDKVEREPVGLVLQVFLLGCIIPVPVIFVESLFESILSIFGNGFLYQLLENFIGVALVEEFFKYLILRIRIWNHKEFNYRFDAIVYAVAASLGFAAVENIAYVFNFGIQVAFSRALLAIPGHTIFAIFMGLYLGKAKYCVYISKKEELDPRTRNNVLARSRHYRRLALLVPVLLHGFYDFVLSIDGILPALLFLAFVIIMDIISIRTVSQTGLHDTSVQE